MKVSVGVSNRHVHLKEEHLKILFGDDYVLNCVRPINQPGQFASTSFVTIKTDKASMEHVRIIGPVRAYTQVEISRTDAYQLGLNPPVRDSGHLDGSETVTIIGPKGSIVATNSTIIADRHIHVTKEHRRLYNLLDKEYVSVVVPGEKGGILGNVRIKETEEAYYELHIDTDDANAFMIKNGDILEIL